ncbi:hypothetical protein A2803_02115 [Candidatus Woesebacteria bacterium RIFCSPHIGHO2_01_FULL_44_21]|uniref:histidine kinase n=1 Tax=Candidatus Woesebacteria bacterium RIFCSPHIGHO2_01_FULL_44_21 TaxID=1802503 RepID=A0A1F7YWA5_9BACT|nr:MAG: hypothetical protein A2803_02115 [Candidatus Woesebacteria bacterium RIFCSPHIGHO2_01_FULL_44_21]OGM69477.1 MAG: hypothetical protein A2897_03950 [Candidatus Woesebacteria bacterium RIFCSPLOWO2_01_FULL_44_24b]
MTRFSSARLKLTLWYLIIVAIVSFSFSAIIYNGVVSELERGFQIAEFHVQSPNNVFVPRKIALQILKDDFELAKKAVTIRLLSINAIIIAASGIAAYILAGKTLEPLQLALEEQKRFTADASHELKTPLTALRTELEVALRDKKLNLKDAKNMLKSNLEEVANLQNLSENLMKLTRYSQGINGIRFNRLNIKIPLEQAIKKVTPMAKAKNIKLRKDISNIEIKADSQSLEELFIILLDNAIKYSPEKSVVIISTLVHRNKVAVDVADQGVGIAKADIPHLFDRFYRADVSRNKTKADGYGLGLAIAKEIVERHKGEISVRSIVDKGSTFTVLLPIS